MIACVRSPLNQLKALYRFIALALRRSPLLRYRFPGTALRQHPDALLNQIGELIDSILSAGTRPRRRAQSRDRRLSIEDMDDE